MRQIDDLQYLWPLPSRLECSKYIEINESLPQKNFNLYFIQLINYLIQT